MVMHLFRNKKTMKIIYFGVAIAFVLSLGYAGITSGLFRPDPDTLAQVNGKAIKTAAFQKAYERSLEQYKSMFKEKEVPEIYRKDIKMGALQNMINQYLLLEYAAQNGITASELEVKERLKGYFSPEGKFNPGYMKYILQMNKITEEELIADIQNSSVISKIQQLVYSSSKVGENEFKEEFAFKYNKKRIKFVKLDYAAFSRQLTISPAELNKIYEERKIEYSTAEQFIAGYFVAPDAAKAKALEITKKLAGKADFSALAKEYSDDPGSKANGGDLGFFKKGSMVPEFEAAAFALKAGETTKEPVLTNFGYHIIKVDEIKNGEIKARHILIKPVEDPKIKAELINKLKAAQKDFEGYAKAASLNIKTGVFSRSNQFVMSDIAAEDQEAVKNAAFRLKPGEVSEPVETKKGFCVLRLQGVIPGSIRPLTDVKNELLDTLKREKGVPKAAEEAEKLFSAIKNNTTTFEAACAKYGIKDTGFLAESDKTIKGVDDLAEFFKSAKSLKIKGDLGRPAKGQTGIYLLQLAEVKEAAQANIEKEKNTFRTELLTRKQQSAFSNFIEELRKKATIKDYSEKYFNEPSPE
jgi:peptidyl-prolyl cis-trans isomerase D